MSDAYSQQGTPKAYAYPKWRGLDTLRNTFGRKVPMKYRECCVCGQPATRVGVIQTTWFRSDDELYALCGPSNACRDALKKREGVSDPYQQDTKEKA